VEKGDLPGADLVVSFRRRLVFKAPLRAVLEEEAIPDLGSGDVLIETIVTLVSTGTEMTAYTGDFPANSSWAEYVNYPFAPGYSNVGKVLAVGEKVSSVSVGEIVFSWSGHCSHEVLGSDQVYRVPEGLDASEAVFGTLGQIALNGVRLSEVSVGESVVVIGVGPLGQLALQLCRLSGAYPVIAMDLSPHRLKMAERHGADRVVNVQEEDPRDAVRQETRGRMADLVFEVTRNQKVIPWALRLLKERGRLLLLGSPRGPVEVDFHDEVHRLELRTIGAHNSIRTSVETPFNQWTLARDLELFYDFLGTGRMSVRDMVTHRYPWRSAPKAYGMLLKERDRSMSVIFDWAIQ